MKIRINFTLLILVFLLNHGWNLTAQDTIPPTVIVIQGLQKLPVYAYSIAMLDAESIDAGSFDNVTPREKLKFYFNGDTSIKLLYFTCSDFIINGLCTNEMTVDIQFWVEDEAGNKNYATLRYYFSDPNSICELGFVHVSHLDSSSRNIEFQVEVNYRNYNIEYVKSGYVELKRRSQAGAYSKSTPFKVDKYSKGVETSDLLKIRNHILGKNIFQDPKQIIAADVNKSRSITGADISQLRKLLLSTSPKDTSRDAWTFVPADYKFENLKDPYSAPRYITWKDSLCNPVNYFHCIKIGDIDGSAKNINAVNTRQIKKKNVQYSIEQTLSKHYKLNLFFENSTKLNTIQFSLQIPKGLELANVESRIFDITEENYYYASLDYNYFNFSYDQSNLCRIGEGEIFLTLYFNEILPKVNFEVVLEDAMIHSELTDEFDNVFGLNLSNSNHSNNKFKIKLIPNPVNDLALFEFNSDNENDCTLHIYDSNLKLLKSIIYQQHIGLNRIHMTIADFPDGVYFYCLESSSFRLYDKFLVQN